MSNEALNTYELIVKNKMFPNASRLKVNIGNIYFKKRDYNKAVKYYRMGLDQVPNIQKRIRLRVMNNIGVAFIMLGNYDEALATFEHCSSEEQDLDSALNLGECPWERQTRPSFDMLLPGRPGEDEGQLPAIVGCTAGGGGGDQGTGRGQTASNGNSLGKRRCPDESGTRKRRTETVAATETKTS